MRFFMSGIFAATTLFPFFVASVAHASLIGDSVMVSLAPGPPFVTDTVLLGLPEPLFQDLGPELGAAGPVPRWDIDFEAATIRVDFIAGPASYGNGISFVFSDLDPMLPGPGFVSNAFLIAEDAPTPFSVAGRIAFGDHFVTVQFAPDSGIVDWELGQFFLIGLEFVPEPSSLILLAAGLVGLLVLKRKRR